MSITPQYTDDQQQLISAIVALTYQLQTHEGYATRPMRDLSVAIAWTRSTLKSNRHAQKIADWLEREATECT